MERGDYGLCEECRQPIASARLMALPYTATCINCQRNTEANRSSTFVGCGLLVERRHGRQCRGRLRGLEDQGRVARVFLGDQCGQVRQNARQGNAAR